MLRELARMFGVPLEAADDVMRSERGYRAAMSRRSLFAAAGALAVGSVMVPGSELARTSCLFTFKDIVVFYNGVRLQRLTGLTYTDDLKPFDFRDITVSATMEIA